jgi:hypothetical protein
MDTWCNCKQTVLKKLCGSVFIMPYRVNTASFVWVFVQDTFKTKALKKPWKTFVMADYFFNKCIQKA